MTTNLSDYAKYLIESKIPEKDGINLITSDKKLTADEKFLLEKYCYPKSLLDRELPSRVQKFLKDNADIDLKIPNVRFASLFVEAFKTEQYGRFMRHLIYSFLNSDNVSPLSGNEEEECALCGKKVYQNDLWQSFIDRYTAAGQTTAEENNKEYLAYGSKESSIVLCKNCIIQLATMKSLIDNIESKLKKLRWDEFKL